MPKVIVTDRDPGLMKAVSDVLPKTTHVLCYFHIEKNVKSRCVTDCRLNPKGSKAKGVDKDAKEEDDDKHCELVKKIVRAWRDVINSPTEDDFAIAWLTFKDEVCGLFPLFVKYVEETVLPLKKHFVRAWTNKYLHLGCRTTNIVESAHAQLKRYLRSSVGDLASCWDEVDKILKNQFGEIQGSFGRSITIMVHKYKKNKLFSELEGRVYKAVLGFIDEEYERSRKFGFAKGDYGCVQMTTYGLPCACMLAEKRKKKLSILLDEIHPHWQQLCVIGQEVDAHFSVTEEWNAIQKRIKRSPYNMKLFIKQKLCELGFPEETMLKPPPRKVATKGAPKRVKSKPKTGRIPSRWETIDAQNSDSQCSHAKSNGPKSKASRLGTCSRSQASSTPTSKPKPYLQIPYISQIPHLMRPYVEDIVNVNGDGNCGFRVVARHMRLNEEDHVLVCHALINELKNHKSYYMPIYATESRYKLILDGLHPPTSKSGIACNAHVRFSIYLNRV